MDTRLPPSSSPQREEATMTQSLVRGKHVVCRVTGPHSADVIADGAVLQRDGQIEAVGDYRELSRQHPDADVIGSGNHIVMPGLVNDHFHVGLTPPSSWELLTCRWKCGAWPASAPV